MNEPLSGLRNQILEQSDWIRYIYVCLLYPQTRKKGFLSQERGKDMATSLLGKIEQAKRGIELEELISVDSHLLNPPAVPLTGVLYVQTKDTEHTLYGKVHKVELIIAGGKRYMSESIKKVQEDTNICDSRVELVDRARYEFSLNCRTEGGLNVLDERVGTIVQEESCHLVIKKSHWFRREDRPEYIFKFCHVYTVSGTIPGILRVKQRYPLYADEHVPPWGEDGRSEEHYSFRESGPYFYRQVESGNPATPLSL